MPDIAVINATSPALNIADAQVRALADALQTQVARDFQPIWGIEAKLQFFSGADAKADRVPKSMWWLAILDDSDQAGALGYHDLNPQGLPMGKVFAGSDLKYGSSWTATASHELLEMLADPDINLTVQVDEPHLGSVLVSYEVCDACEADQYAYRIGEVLVSDFVTPAWFEPFRKPASVTFDFQQKIKQPLQLLPGGYIGVLKVTAAGGWQQITARGLSGGATPYAHGTRPRVGTRRERRALPRAQWLYSDLAAGFGMGINRGAGVAITV